MGVVEGDPTLLKVEAHAEPGGQGVGDARRRRGAGAVGHGLPGAVAMVTVVVAAVLGEVDLAHAHGEEAEGRGRVQRVLCSTIMAAVGVVAAGAGDKKGQPQQSSPARRVFRPRLTASAL